MDYSQSQLKNIKFGNQIRNRYREEYFKKKRNQFLEVGNQQKNAMSSSLAFNAFLEMLSVEPCQKNIQLINEYLIKNRESITEDSFRQILSYLKLHFLGQNNQTLETDFKLNDYLALLSNCLALRRYEQLSVSFCDEMVVDKVLSLFNRVCSLTDELIVWVLYSVCKICASKLILKVGSHQLMLKEKVGVQNPYFMHLLCQISIHTDISPEILNELISIDIYESTNKQFCFNVVDILQKSLQYTESQQFVGKLLVWVERNIYNRHFPSLIKSQLFTLLYVLVRRQLSLQNISWLLDSRLIDELIQRAKFEGIFYNKCITTFIICELVRSFPILYLHLLVFRNLEIIDVLIEALSLLQNDIILDCLRALSKIIINWPSEKQLRERITESNLKKQLHAICLNPCQQISNMAIAILEEYLEK